MTGRVSALRIYPVKSMRGCALSAARIFSRGFEGDRLFAVRDEAGKFGSGKNTRRFARMDGLALWSARMNGAHLQVMPPDGEWMDADSGAVAALLTAQVGRPVTIAREADISHFDAAPIHILTTGDLVALERLSGARPPFESFRPNVLIETQELSRDWIGRRVKIGEAELDIVAPTERCLMVNVAPDGNRGPDFVRPLAQHMDDCFGVYASVAREGVASAGDAVEPAS